MEITMQGISKAFGSNEVLRGVDFTLHSGEIHALMGENGAGKSTLMNILTGIHKADAGKIFVDGQEVHFKNARDAENHGIAFIHQELNIWPNLSILENLFLMKQITNSFGILDTKKMRKLAEEKCAQIGIELPLDAEVFTHCDTITVMRDGHSISCRPTRSTTMEAVVQDMVGRAITEYYPGRTTEPGEVVLEVKNLCQPGVFDHVSFNLRKGEILGVAGLMGAGRTEIMRALFGIDDCRQGEVYLHGQKINIKKPEDAIKAGIGFITENRKTEGLILDFSILKNIALPSVDTFASKSVINDKKEFNFSNELSHKLGVKANSIQLPAGALSGGNQQKVVIAKWIGMHPSIIIMDEPTRGIDVGAKRDIYDLMNELTAQGVAIIMVSSDLPEVIGMSDRILVVHEGKIAGEIPHDQATQENIITLATGGI